MIYYIYFNGYGQPKKAISSDDLMIQFENDQNKFMAYMIDQEQKDDDQYVYGHVGMLRCADEKELYEYLMSLGDEIEGLYEGHMDARPYNF